MPSASPLNTSYCVNSSPRQAAATVSCTATCAPVQGCHARVSSRASGGTIADMQTRRAGVHGVHSLQGFSMSVPALDDARAFFAAFGLDTQPHGSTLALHTAGHSHRWGTVREGPRKKLDH